MKRIIFALLLMLSAGMCYAQRNRNHNVKFYNVDGFSGYVTFYTLYRAPDGRLHGKNAKLTITDADLSADEKKALKEAGLNLSHYNPPVFSVVVEGEARHYKQQNGATGYFSAPARLEMSNGLDDYTNVEFGPEAAKAQKEHFKKFQSSLWELYGSFNNVKVTQLYLTDLENEIDLILAKYDRQKRAFESAIERGTSEANDLNIEGAKYELAAAEELSNDSSEHISEISKLKTLISYKKIDKEKKDREEEQEKKRQEEKKKKTQQTAGGKSADDKKEEDDESEDGPASKEESSFNPYSAYQDYMKAAKDARAQGNYAEADKYYNMAKSLNIYGTHEEINKQMIDNNIEQIGQAGAPLLANAFDNATGTNGLLEFSYINDKDEWQQYKLGWVNQGYWWNFFSVTFGANLFYIENTPMWVMDNDYSIPQSSLDPNFKSYISKDRFVFRDIRTTSTEISMTYKAYQLKTTAFGMEPFFGIGFYIPFRYLRPNFLFTVFYGGTLGYSDYTGYRASGRLDIGKRMTIGVNYSTIFHSKNAFLPSYFMPGRADYTISDMDRLIENNERKNNRIELTLGFKFMSWGN